MTDETPSVPGPGQPASERESRVSDWWSREAGKRASEDYMLDWSNSPAIQSMLNRRATGSEDLNWLQWVKARLPGGQAARALSIGCGTGGLERDAIDQGLCQSALGIDIAPGAIEIARQESAGLPVEYEVLDLQKGILEPGSFDLVFCASALHHMTHLAYCLEQIWQGLKDGGHLVLFEYFGPSRFQWTPLQLKIVMDIYSFLPAAYRFNLFKNGTELFPMRPGIAEMIDADPSEAVRSSEMLEVVEWYFEPVEKLVLGGTLLNPLLSGIVGNFDHSDPHDLSFLDLVSLLEEFLISSGVLAPDFSVIILEKRRVPAVPPGGREADAAASALIGEQEREILRLLEERKERVAEYAVLEKEFLRLVDDLNATGPRAAAIQKDIDRLRLGELAGGQDVEPPPGFFDALPATMDVLGLVASREARASADEVDPDWLSWAAAAAGVRPCDLKFQGGKAEAGGSVITLRWLPGEGGELYGPLTGCLPPGCGFSAGERPDEVLVHPDDPGSTAEPVRRCFFAGRLESGQEQAVQPGSQARATPMEKPVRSLFSYVSSEAATAGMARPAVEVAVYSPSIRQPATAAPRIAEMQADEIERLERLLEESRTGYEKLLVRAEAARVELTRAEMSLDALVRERSIMARPALLRKAGLRLEARRRRKLGL